MPSRLFIGNFDFEHRLEDPKRESSAALKSLYAQLASAWLAVAEDGDWIWTPQPIEPSFWDEMALAGLPKVRGVVAFTEVPRDVHCVPWGWSDDIRQLVARFGWQAEIPEVTAIRIANSRATSAELEQLWGVGLPGAGRVDSLEQLQESIDALKPQADRWVVKSEFGMSARERILGHGRLKPADENWVRRRLSTRGGVYFEPWVNCLEEIGIQIDIPKTGEPKLIGLTPMMVDERGQYAGSWFTWHDARFRFSRADWSTSIDVALRAAQTLKSRGYFGPLGIDSMAYQDLDGTIRFRPLQDLNARWTMGRLSLGWQRLLRSNEEGEWRLSRHHVGQSVSADADVCRVISTSPRQMNGFHCHHVAQVLIHSAREHRADSPATPSSSSFRDDDPIQF